jgi:kanamycin kinase
MTLTPIVTDIEQFPEPLRPILEGAAMYDSSCSEAARVIFIDKDGGYLFKTDTLLHGDYCLPNIILDDWKLSGFIDLDSGGAGDRHVDIFWGVWSLFFNLKTDKYRDRFLDAYGRSRVDEDMLRVVAAVEVFK